MERKIGEIFEYNGEWCQCIKAIKGCNECSLFDKRSGSKCFYIEKCSALYRNDRTSVIFKKLEKIGFPHEFNSKVKGIILLQKYKMFTEPYINGVICNIYYEDNTIDIEVKQNKEDMEEEKKIKFGELVHKFINNKITYNTFENEVIELFNNKKESKPVLKDFDLEAAKAGKPVCTRDGRNARIICFDTKGDKPIIALVETKGNKDILIEDVERYFINGHAVFEVGESELDLMMLSEKKEGWVTIYKHIIYKTKEAAKSNVNLGMELIDTIKIEWEE